MSFWGIVSNIGSQKSPPKEWVDAVKELRAEGYVQAKPLLWSDFASQLNSWYKSKFDYKVDMVRAGTFRKPLTESIKDMFTYSPDPVKVAVQEQTTGTSIYANVFGSGSSSKNTSYIIVAGVVIAAAYFLPRFLKK